jgi:hypothetical protein
MWTDEVMVFTPDGRVEPADAIDPSNFTRTNLVAFTESLLQTIAKPDLDGYESLVLFGARQESKRYFREIRGASPVFGHPSIHFNPSHVQIPEHGGLAILRGVALGHSTDREDDTALVLVKVANTSQGLRLRGMWLGLGPSHGGTGVTNEFTGVAQVSLRRTSTGFDFELINTNSTHDKSGCK